MCRFYLVDTVEYLINLQWRRSHCNANGVLVDLPYGAQEWKIKLDKQDRQGNSKI